MNRFLENARSRPVAVVVATAAPLVVVVWHLFALAARPPHLNQIVAELGSTMRFVANPCPNHAGTRLVFLQTTEHGYGVFFSEAPGKRRLLYEQINSGAGYGNLDEALLGWSPEDEYFAYCRHTTGWEIVVCDGNSGAVAGVVPVNSLISIGAWLGPELLAVADDKRVLSTIRRHHDQWVQPLPFNCFRSADRDPDPESSDLGAVLHGPPIRGFAAYGADAVVWQQGGTIFTCGPESEAPMKIWASEPGSPAAPGQYYQSAPHPIPLPIGWGEGALRASEGNGVGITTVRSYNTVIEFSAFPPRKLVVHGRDSSGEYLARLYPTNQLRDVIRLSSNRGLPIHPMLLNDAEGYAYLTQTGSDPDRLVLKPGGTQPASEIVWQDQVRYFTAINDAVYVISSLNDQPPGIWKCHASGATECVVPNVEKPFRYVRNSHIDIETITNAAGEALACYVLAPAHLTGHGKHPLVIGILGNMEMGFNWSANHEAIANCGAFFVTVDRHQRGLHQWADDAFAAYEALVQRPEVDPNKVLLYGDSVGIYAVYQLLERNPKLWRGAILFSPTSFPEPSRIPGMRLFLDNGGADTSFGKEGIEVPRRFQDAAARAGLPITLLIHPGLGHVFRMPTGERERMREALIFLGGS